jgi:isocitrate dehydrogenase
VNYANSAALNLPKYKRKPALDKQLEGVDVFVQWNGLEPNQLAQELKKIEPKGIELTMITNRGIKVWPDGFKETFCTDHWRCRFKSSDNTNIQKENIIELLNNALRENIDTIKTENLYAFNGKSAYSLGQGQ